MNNKPINIVHLHSDTKFIKNTLKRFQNKNFCNKVVVVSKNAGTANHYDNLVDLSYPALNPRVISAIVDICNDADVLVLYGLDSFKRTILKRVSSNVFCIWWFFGYELYSVSKNEYISKQTIRILNSPSNCMDKLKKINISQLDLNKINNYFFKLFIHGKVDISDSMKKINVIIMTSVTEYDLLKHEWLNLPKFVKSPHISNTRSSLRMTQKQPIIIIGNSRNHWNNHIDMINLVKGAKKNKNYEFYLLFSYGDTGHYSKTIRNAVINLDNFHLIEKFMSNNDFYNFYSGTSALAINSYRQLALGNIFTALSSGVKVYLNKKNTTYKWLKDEGFKISDINQLKKDIDNKNVTLTCNQMLYNQKQVKALAKKYSLKKFHQQLSLITKSNKYDKKNN